jgi:hypothetical protein
MTHILLINEMPTILLSISWILLYHRFDGKPLLATTVILLARNTKTLSDITVALKVVSKVNQAHEKNDLLMRLFPIALGVFGRDHNLVPVTCHKFYLHF